MRYISRSPDETRAIGESLAGELKPGSIICLDGQLGAGKTAFVQGLAKGLGIIEPVISPTFSIMCVYRGEQPLVHMDAYRLESVDDLESTGFFDYLDGRCIIAVEWSERIADLLPPDTIRVTIESQDENTRSISVEGGAEAG